MNEVALKYQAKTDLFQQKIEQESRPLQWIPWVRLVMITTAFLFVYLYFRDKFLPHLVLMVISLGIFLFSGWYDARVKRRIKRLQILVAVCSSELKSLNGDYSDFDSGNEFIDPAHPYAYDLDIFGTQSIFQAANRSATIFGKERLSAYFRNAYHWKAAIPARQEAVAELAGMDEFRNELRVIFSESASSVRDQFDMERWLSGTSGLQWLEKIKPLLYLAPAITLGMIAACLTGAVPAIIPALLFSVQLMAVFALSRQVHQAHAAVNSRVNILKRYAMALQLINRQHFKSVLLAEKQTGLNIHDLSPGKVIGKLANLLGFLDSNLNMLVAVILNGLFMFNLHIILGVERWRKRYSELVPGWFELLAEVDALSSLGNFAYNNPDYAYPKPEVEGDFTFDAVQMGHPLIPESECVRNDLKIKGWNQFRIITGANMSGKSTFLRTVGINCVLGMAGAPVCAESLTFSPVEIHSSIRTSDSLARRESYFYAELRRLKEIVDELRSGKQKLVLLDEILKGTNSADKQAGSIALIRHLLNYRLAGLFATHDLTLGTLIHDFPENIENLCFEISIAGEQMEISYKLTDGVCRNLNASFLMKKMNIIS